jgi:hypothetical protein
MVYRDDPLWSGSRRPRDGHERGSHYSGSQYILIVQLRYRVVEERPRAPWNTGSLPRYL